MILKKSVNISAFDIMGKFLHTGSRCKKSATLEPFWKKSHYFCYTCSISYKIGFEGATSGSALVLIGKLGCVSMPCKSDEKFKTILKWYVVKGLRAETFHRNESEFLGSKSSICASNHSVSSSA